MNGWVKLWRKTLGSAVFTSLPAADLKVFVASLLLANNRPRSWYNGQGEEEIPRGSFVTSQPKLAELTRLTRKQVRGALDRLQKIGAIWAKQRAKRYTVITVANFEAYQGTDDQPGQETGLSRANAGPTPGHNVRSKKEEVIADAPSASASTSTGKGNGKPVDPNVRVIIESYHAAFLKRHGTPPPINGGKCGKIAKAMLRGRPVEEAVWVVEEFFTSPPPFYRDKGLYGLEHVLAAMPTLLARRAELERGA